MKGLLQSKRFKKNLSKWVFMYVICMGVFTTVITYSKYISGMMDDKDMARVSKFNIALKYCADANCETEATEPFDPERYRPYEEIIYYFAVDKSQMEVGADLLLTIKVDEHFKITRVVRPSEEDKVIPNESQSQNGKVFTISNAIIPGNHDLAIYQVTVMYDDKVVDKDKDGNVINGIVNDESGNPKYIFNEKKDFEVMTVDYSVVQMEQ